MDFSTIENIDSKDNENENEKEQGKSKDKNKDKKNKKEKEEKITEDNEDNEIIGITVKRDENFPEW